MTTSDKDMVQWHRLAKALGITRWSGLEQLVSEAEKRLAVCPKPVSVIETPEPTPGMVMLSQEPSLEQLQSAAYLIPITDRAKAMKTVKKVFDAIVAAQK
jgi:hypothetical protein